MEKVPHFNDSDQVAFVGGVLIPPRDTRDVDPTLLPGYALSTADDVASPTGPQHIVDVLLQKSAAEILAAIPTLAPEDLEQLGEREQQGAARKEILAALAERLLTLASESHDQSLQSANSGAPEVENHNQQEDLPEQPNDKSAVPQTETTPASTSEAGA